MKTLLITMLSLAMVAPCLAATRMAQQEPVDARPRLIMVAQNGARGMAFEVYIRLQKGMSEGELLSYAGKPDSDSVENFRDYIVKTYYYLPTVSDPWITTVTLQGGKITNIERVRKN